MSMVLISPRKIGWNAVIWLVGGFVYNLFFVYTAKLLFEISNSISNYIYLYLCIIQGRTRIFLFLRFRLVYSITNTAAAASSSEESAIFTKKSCPIKSVVCHENRPILSADKIGRLSSVQGGYCFLNKFAAKWGKHFLPYLNNVSPLPWETWNATMLNATSATIA